MRANTMRMLYSSCVLTGLLVQLTLPRHAIGENGQISPPLPGARRPDEEPADSYELPGAARRFSRVAPAVALEPSDRSNGRFDASITSSSEAITSRDRPVAEGQPAATSLLRQAMISPDTETSASRPLTLLQALGNTSDRAQQLSIVRQYWQVAMKRAARKWDAESLKALEDFSDPADPQVRRLVTAAIESARARELESRIALIASQRELAAAAKLSSGTLFHPTDEPLVAEYKSNYDLIFAQRAAPDRIRQLVVLLPLRQQAISAWAGAVTAREVVLSDLTRQYESGNCDVSRVLDEFDRLRQERGAFLQGVREYNLSIAEYSLNVVGNAVSNDALVGTLVRRASPERSAMKTSKSPSGFPAGGARAAKSSATPRSSSPKPKSQLDEPARIRIRSEESSPRPTRNPDDEARMNKAYRDAPDDGAVQPADTSSASRFSKTLENSLNDSNDHPTRPRQRSRFHGPMRLDEDDLQQDVAGTIEGDADTADSRSRGDDAMDEPNANEADHDETDIDEGGRAAAFTAPEWPPGRFSVRTGGRNPVPVERMEDNDAMPANPRISKARTASKEETKPRFSPALPRAKDGSASSSRFRLGDE